MHLLSFLSYLIHSLMAWQTEAFSISLHSYTSILLEYVKYLNLLKSCWMLHFEVEIFFSFIGFNCQSWIDTKFLLQLEFFEWSFTGTCIYKSLATDDEVFNLCWLKVDWPILQKQKDTPTVEIIIEVWEKIISPLRPVVIYKICESDDDRIATDQQCFFFYFMDTRLKSIMN